MIKEYEVLLCDPDPQWSTCLQQGMQEEGICLRVVKELEELWQQREYCMGIIVNIEEIDSMLFWGKADHVAMEEKRLEVLRSLLLIQPRVIIVIPENDYDLEYQCLAAGAAECIHKDQPMQLIQTRLRRVLFWNKKNLRFGEVILETGMRRLSWRGYSVSLTELEGKLMERLMYHGSQLTDKSELLWKLWQKGETKQQNRLNTIIRQLRKKIKNLPIGIVTCYGKGYYLEEHNSDKRMRVIDFPR